MTTRYIENYNECTDPVTGDFFWIVDASAAAGDKDRKVDVGLFPRLAAANTFTRGITTTPSSLTDYGVNINMPASIGSTIRALRWTYDGTLRGYAQADATSNTILLAGFDNGSGAGPSIQVQRNNNSGTPSPGFLTLLSRTGGVWRVYPDSSGVLRIYSAGDPTNAVDVANSGTVVGSQSSNIDFKNVLGDPVGDEVALQSIVDAAARVKRFVYKSGSYNGQEFSGLVLSGDTLDRYGMDADVNHGAGKSLNLITVIGDLLLAVRNLSERVAALEAA